MEQFLALVAVENVSYHFDILYGYTYSENLKESVKPGVRVQIPFGRNVKKPRQGIVFECGLKPRENIRYKSIASVLDVESVYTEEMLSLERRKLLRIQPFQEWELIFPTRIHDKI